MEMFPQKNKTKSSKLKLNILKQAQVKYVCTYIPTKYRSEVQNLRTEMDNMRKVIDGDVIDGDEIRKKIEGKDKTISEMKTRLPLSVPDRKYSRGILIKITEQEKETIKEMKITSRSKAGQERKCLQWKIGKKDSTYVLLESWKKKSK